MYSKALIAAASAALLGRAAAEDAMPASNNPVGAAYKAMLPEEPFFESAALEGNIKGGIWAETAADQVGTKFTVKFENLPKEGGPFSYHIHVHPATDGNCTSTGGHLDPTNRMDKPACEADKPASCQVGDLSGKYGKITEDPFTAEYTDPFTSLQPGQEAFFGDRSFVIHFANGTRLTCANFEKAEGKPAPTQDCDSTHITAMPTHTNKPTGGMTSPGGSNPTQVPITGGATSAAVSVLAVIGAALLL
ncbi:hypothetical protein K4F52_002323 [Lecanicillium sp. MT-2017a]|nr:hypothetical protein K4F52_002323 [Lecanicillium sp. MT-2017a]